MIAAVEPGWTSIALLGALHGVNPAMGWLFAVSLGLQAQRGRAVWSALAPLALGHALAVVAALAVAAGLGVVVPLDQVKWIAAAALLGVGVRHLRSHAHPGWGVAGMRVGAGQLTAWSFLVSTAHGAGLMVLPFVLGAGAGAAGAEAHAAPAGAGGAGGAGGMHAAHLAGIGAQGEHTVALIGTLLHTAGYLAVSGAIAWIVYARFGVRFLRRAWINMDFIWAAALIATALATPFL